MPRPARHPRGRRFNPDVERLFEAYLAALLFPDPEQQAAAVAGFVAHAIPSVKELVLIRLVDHYLDEAASRTTITAALRALGTVAVEILKLRVFLTRKPALRVLLVDLLAKVCRPNDLLVYLVLHDLERNPDEPAAVRATAREAVQRCCPELAAPYPPEAPPVELTAGSAQPQAAGPRPRRCVSKHGEALLE